MPLIYSLKRGRFCISFFLLTEQENHNFIKLTSGNKNITPPEHL
jgi:hypothetical protein